MKRILGYLSEVRLELGKVSWPKRSEVIKLTLTVFIISAIFGVYTGSLDYIFTKILELIISR